MKAAFVPQAYAGGLGSCDQEKGQGLLFPKTSKSSVTYSLLICCARMLPVHLYFVHINEGRWALKCA